MIYELAKKLKDAGFPQGNPEKTLGEQFHVHVGEQTKPRAGIYIDGVLEPTLSELIEACGNKFDNLCVENLWRTEQEPKVYAANHFIDLFALEELRKKPGIKNEEVDKIVIKGVGSTPEEAVAMLWLKLNKK